MKHCPQCDFLYEDDQDVCDMDGKDLVSDRTNVFAKPDIATSVSATPTTESDIPTNGLGRRRWRNFALATLLGFVLAGLVVVIYLALNHQMRSRRGLDRSAEEIPAQSISGDPNGQSSSSDLASPLTPAPDDVAAERSLAQSSESSSTQSDDQATLASAKESLAHTRLTPGPVSASTPSGNGRGPVIVRLTNGAAIRADEAWEKREGIWYRQGGVVTFLKRSQVRAIERLPSPTPRAKSVAYNSPEKSRQTESAPEPKKESKVSSFLKKTGRILKKPFKF